MIWPVLLRATLRQLRHHGDWSRTDRVAIDADTAPESLAA